MPYRLHQCSQSSGTELWNSVPELSSGTEFQGTFNIFGTGTELELELLNFWNWNGTVGTLKIVSVPVPEFLIKTIKI